MDQRCFIAKICSDSAGPQLNHQRVSSAPCALPRRHDRCEDIASRYASVTLAATRSRRLLAAIAPLLMHRPVVNRNRPTKLHCKPQTTTPVCLTLSLGSLVDRGWSVLAAVVKITHQFSSAATSGQGPRVLPSTCPKSTRVNSDKTTDSHNSSTPPGPASRLD